jgi:glycosyltransferase involved in cell wall biosynthesis
MSTNERAPSVSVLIPVYNKAPYLRRAVDSVLTQTFADLEIVLVDDGSTDGSLDAARSFTDPRVRVIAQANAGAGAARNRAIREARAPMLALLDGDDEWAPTFLEAMMALAAEYPRAGLYCGPYVFVEPGGVRVEPRWVDVPARGLLPSYFRSVAMGDQVATATSVCVPRAVFEALGVFETDRLGEDQDMWARIALAYPVAAINGPPLAIYFRNAQGRVMHTSAPDAEQPYSRALQRQLDADTVPAPMREDVKLYIEKGLITLVSLNLRAGQPEVARRLLKDPRIRRFWARRELWRVLAVMPGLVNLGLAAKDMVRERSIFGPLRKYGLTPWNR